MARSMTNYIASSSKRKCFPESGSGLKSKKVYAGNGGSKLTLIKSSEKYCKNCHKMVADKDPERIDICDEKNVLTGERRHRVCPCM